MKKFLIGAMIVALMVIMGGGLQPAHADGRFVGEPDVYVIANETGDRLASVMDSTLFVPGKHRIISWSVSHLGNEYTVDTEIYGAIFDAATLGEASSQNVEGERESTDEDSISRIYASPQSFKDGVVTIQGAWTVFEIEYERFRP